MTEKKMQKIVERKGLAGKLIWSLIWAIFFLIEVVGGLKRTWLEIEQGESSLFNGVKSEYH